MGINMKNPAAVAAVVIGIATATMMYFMIKEQEVTLCKTKECVTAAAKILNSLDTTADPCNDFYQYACGGWIEENPVKEDESTVNTFSVLREKNSAILKKLLSENDPEDREAIQNAKAFYRSCIDEDTIDSLGGKPALDLIETLGGMPLFGDDYDEKNFDLAVFLAETKMRAYSPLISMSVGSDNMNSSVNIIRMDQPSLTMPSRKYYLVRRLRDETLPHLRRYMLDYLGMLWQSKAEVDQKSKFNAEKLENFVDEVIQFETDLADIVVPAEERRQISKIYNKMKISDISTRVSSKFDWWRYLKGIIDKSNQTITPSTEVIIYSTPYLSKLMDLLENYDTAFLRNYVVWYSLNRNRVLLPKVFRSTAIPYINATTGVTKERDRWETCVGNTDIFNEMAVGSLYVKSVLSDGSKEVMMEMIDDLELAFKNELPRTTWMDDETKAGALKKIAGLVRMIGYPDYVIDDENPKLEELQGGVIMDDKSYFANVIKHRFHYFVDALNKLEKPVDREEWIASPATVNAYYSSAVNSITFPAGILQAPFFDISRPFVMNYGAIGSIIGHEITHAFDDHGSQFNEIGNLHNWWSNFSQSKFNEKSQCMREQYSGMHYEMAETNLNGNLTIGENIADNGAIRQSYEAYQIWNAANPGKEFRIPGLEQYTTDQLFFIANALNWCADEKKQRAKQRVTISRHSPYQFRVEVPYINYEKFGEAFGCERGTDKLYPLPEETCRVW